MKKNIFVLIVFYALSISAIAQLSCPIYRADGATATVLRKGGQSDSRGTLDVPVQVDNAKSSTVVWVEVVDQNTGCAVKRASDEIWVNEKTGSGKGSIKVTGLTPNHDYLYRIDSAKLCE